MGVEKLLSQQIREKHHISFGDAFEFRIRLTRKFNEIAEQLQLDHGVSAGAAYVEFSRGTSTSYITGKFPAEHYWT